MPDTIGKFVKDGSGGKPSIDTVTQSNDGIKDSVREPEIIAGYEVEGPDTEPIASGGATGGPRLTKSGKVDRRTLRGKSTTDAPEETSVRLSAISLTDAILGLHEMAAEFFKTPELELDKEEAAKLSEATQNVAKYYAIAFNPKKVAIFNLAVCMTTIYGTRFVAIRNKHATTKKEQPKPIATQQMKPQPVNGASIFDIHSGASADI